jgi:hypothetical protein
MMSNITKTWLRDNLRDIQRLAEAGHAICKAILDARAQYARTSDQRWLDNLTTNIATYIRWSESRDGNAAIENARQPKAAQVERRGALRNKTQRINVAKPAARPTKQTRNQRTIR